MTAAMVLKKSKQVNMVSQQNGISGYFHPQMIFYLG